MNSFKDNFEEIKFNSKLMSAANFNIKGLTQEEVIAAREKYGRNELQYKRENRFVHILKSVVSDPMVILLLVTSSIYFIIGQLSDGIFLAAAILLVSAISIYQDWRSRDALDKLKSYTEPSCKVIRDGNVLEIHSSELVVGDYLMVEEGVSISADGKIVHSNDFSVNEAILTGEGLAVIKSKDTDDNMLYHGTNVASGLAIAIVTAVGNNTKLGRIGKSIESIVEEKTPLELQIGNFVRKMVIVGAIVFIIVWVMNYVNSRSVFDSLLKALTLAMSILPEEIPVALSTFMALGAWRMMKLGVVVKQMKTVETLGSATVICTDKTGTITENKMSLARLFVLKSGKIISPELNLNEDEQGLIKLAMWASEPIPFDPMEVALHNAYTSIITEDERRNYKIIHEYPLEGKPPMMTHLFEDVKGNRIIAAKGAPEAIMEVSNINNEERKTIQDAIKTLAEEGFRILAVAETKFNSSTFPEKQQEFPFVFKGLVAFYDPPKANINKVLDNFYKAGIKVKIVTGDYAVTTVSIAKQIGFRGWEKSITGDELMLLNEVELKQKVGEINLFTRMFPDAKLKIINALKAGNEIVAMTGDGVNDGPALKAAHIGIAMGKKGTEIAKQAASLILTEDDLAKMVDAVAMGRRIYTNLKKAIQYIISIHIPIILTVFIPLVLGWIYPNIFSPVHIIFLELIMGPTCSIIYENEPMEKDTMDVAPRPFTVTFFNMRELTTSIAQGLAITAGTLSAYQYALAKGLGEGETRTIVFTVLISANIFLTLVNRSFHHSILKTIRYKNNMLLLIMIITIGISGLLIYIKPLSNFFLFERLDVNQLSISTGIGFISVIWFEIIKWINRLKENSK